MDQFLRSIHRYVQLGVHIKGYYSPELKRFKREVAEVVEFYVNEENKPEYKILFKRTPDGKTILQNPSKYLLGYLESQGVIMASDILVKEEFHDANNVVGNNNQVSNNNFSNQSNNVNYVNSGVVTNQNMMNQVPVGVNQVQGNIGNNVNYVANRQVVSPNVVSQVPVNNIQKPSTTVTYNQNVDNTGVTNANMMNNNQLNNIPENLSGNVVNYNQMMYNNLNYGRVG